MRWICIVLVLASFAPTSRCQGAEPAVESKDAVKAKLTLLNAEGKESTSFAVGERITLRLVVTNHGSEPRNLSCSTSRTSDARIRAGDDELWHWSRGRMFAQVITDLELAPGGSRKLDLFWDQTTNDDEPVGAGKYEVDGWVPAVDGEVRAPSVKFSIDPS